MLDDLRFGLPVDQWPEPTRQRSNTIGKPYRLATGRFLAYCGAMNYTVSEESARSYLDWYKARVNESTNTLEIHKLRLALPALYPEIDWGWLFAIGALKWPAKKTIRKQTPSDRSPPLAIPPEEWPEEARAVLANGPTPAVGAARFETILRRLPRPLSAAVKRGIKNAYGQYLNHRRTRGESDTITPEGVASFAAGLEDRGLRPRAIAVYIRDLLALVKAAKFPGDWAWLKADAADLVQRSAAHPKRKHARDLPHPKDIWKLGLSLVEKARASGPGSVTAAKMHRDGVLLMLAISQPLRLSNLAGLKIGSSLIFEEDGGIRVVFAGSEMKGRRPHSARIWDELRPLLEEYIAKWRPVLARGYTGPELWLGAKNARDHPILTSKGIQQSICARTRAEFGEPINPHLLRDIAATAMIEADPTQPRLASDLLQHHSPDVIREYTEQASSLVASRTMRTAVAAARAKAQSRMLDHR